MNPRILIYAGRAISLAWAGFWLFFGIASGLSENVGPVGALLHAVLPGGVAFLTTCAAWRWPTAGGGLLVLEGLLLAVVMLTGVLNPANPSGALFLVATLVAPPIVAGLLFVGGSWRPRPQHPSSGVGSQV
jgi:hypothetical protein